MVTQLYVLKKRIKHSMCLRATVIVLNKTVVVAKIATVAALVVKIVLVVGRIVVVGVEIMLDNVVVVANVAATITTEVEGLVTGSTDLSVHLVQLTIAILIKDRLLWILVWQKVRKMWFVTIADNVDITSVSVLSLTRISNRSLVVASNI